MNVRQKIKKTAVLFCTVFCVTAALAGCTKDRDEDVKETVDRIQADADAVDILTGMGYSIIIDGEEQTPDREEIERLLEDHTVKIDDIEKTMEFRETDRYSKEGE